MLCGRSWSKDRLRLLPIDDTLDLDKSKLSSTFIHNDASNTYSLSHNHVYRLEYTVDVLLHCMRLQVLQSISLGVSS
jgi:hypothetical protein